MQRTLSIMGSATALALLLLASASHAFMTPLHTPQRAAGGAAGGARGGGGGAVAVDTRAATAGAATGAGRARNVDELCRRGSALALASAVDSEVPLNAARQECLYDMVYVERLPDEVITTSGLLLPTKQDPRLHVGKILSIGPGREGEGGYVTEPAGIKVGDLVYLKDPWGIGPRDDEFSGRKFSFVKYESICAVVPDEGGAYEEAARKSGAMMEAEPGFD